MPASFVPTAFILSAETSQREKQNRRLETALTNGKSLIGNDRSRAFATASILARAKERHRALAALVDAARVQGARTHKEVAARLNADGHRTAQGYPWDANNLRQVLRRLKVD